MVYAIELDLCVIIDWHILSDGNPNLSKDRAIKFFEAMSRQYKNNPNVLYEICNEPNGDVTWAIDIKPYAATHKDDLREKLSKALKLELPIIVSEFGISDASGSGEIDYEQGTISPSVGSINHLNIIGGTINNKISKL